jgi:hypothetical protein
LWIQNECSISNLYLDGCLILKDTHYYKNINISDKIYHKVIPIDPKSKNVPDFIKIRGFDLKKKSSRGPKFKNCPVEGHSKH